MAEITTLALAAALIGVFEGEKLQAYQDTGGVWTIGIGHTKGVEPGMVITHEQSLEFFAQDAQPLLAMVASRPVLEAAALVSYGFNCGAGALYKIISGQDTLSNPKHTTDRKGNTLRGLVARRRLEETLILLSDDLKKA